MEEAKVVKVNSQGQILNEDEMERPLPNEVPKELQAQSISEVDRLKIENMMLKALKASQQRTILLLQIQQAEREFNSMNEELQSFQVELAKKYNINYSTHAIEEHTGKIVARK